MGVLDKYRGEQAAVPLLRAEEVANGERTWVIQGPPFTVPLDGGPKDALPLRSIKSGARRDLVLKKANGLKVVLALDQLGRVEDTIQGLILDLSTEKVKLRGRDVDSITVVAVRVQ